MKGFSRMLATALVLGWALLTLGHHGANPLACRVADWPTCYTIVLRSQLAPTLALASLAGIALVVEVLLGPILAGRDFLIWRERHPDIPTNWWFVHRFSARRR